MEFAIKIVLILATLSIVAGENINVNLVVNPGTPVIFFRSTCDTKNIDLDLQLTSSNGNIDFLISFGEGCTPYTIPGSKIEFESWIGKETVNLAESNYNLCLRTRNLVQSTTVTGHTNIDCNTISSGFASFMVILLLIAGIIGIGCCIGICVKRVYCDQSATIVYRPQTDMAIVRRSDTTIMQQV